MNSEIHHFQWQALLNCTLTFGSRLKTKLGWTQTYKWKYKNMLDSWESNKAMKAQYHHPDAAFQGKQTGKPIFKILKEKGFSSMKE